MKRLIPITLLAVAAVIFSGVGQAHAAIIGFAGGTAAPSSTLGTYTMTPLPLDARTLYDDVMGVPSPLGGTVDFSIELNHRRLGSGWATWSHGYTGDVYFGEDELSVTLTLPSDTAAFYLYAEPNPYLLREIVATTATGESVSQMVEGNGGASYYGFYTTAGEVLTTITVSSLTTDFAIGEFGIAVPEPATIGLLAMGALALLRRRRA